jgi:hypothetical protein
MKVFLLLLDDRRVQIHCISEAQNLTDPANPYKTSSETQASQMSETAHARTTYLSDISGTEYHSLVTKFLTRLDRS